ncbi:hypothetical protein C4J84_0377 [Pseudomonas sp. R11-23-07]|nr:hypothetical protein C4J84_0377 [Pseudomonas sp. R11-23-07]
MVRSRLLRTHLYLYVQAYAIKRPTFRARVWIFSKARGSLGN